MNHFLQIWMVVTAYLKRLYVRTWQLLFCLLGLSVCTILLIYCNEIAVFDTELRLDRRGAMETSDLKIRIGCNSGTLMLKDSVAPSSATFTACKMRGYGHHLNPELQHGYEQKFGQHPLLENLWGEYTLSATYSEHSRAIDRGLFTMNYDWDNNPRLHAYRAENGSCLFTMASADLHKNRGTYKMYRGIAFPDKEAKFRKEDIADDATMDIRYKWYNGRSKMPSLLQMWDISQHIYRFRLRLPHSTDFRELAFEFMGPAEFSPMGVQPDEISFSGFKFTDSLKLARIEREGLTYHARFPQLENLQSIRNFGLTTLLSLLFSLTVALAFKLARQELRAFRFRRTRRRAA